MRPPAAVATPSRAMVTRMPRAKRDDSSQGPPLAHGRSWPWMNPTISGMLARWQGLSRMLGTPQAKAAARAPGAATRPARRSGIRIVPSRWALQILEFDAQFAPLGQDVFLGEETFVAEQFVAVGGEENLGGDDLDAVGLAALRDSSTRR